MVNQRLVSFLFVALASAWPLVGKCDESILQKIDAEKIEKGCDVEFYALPDKNPPIGQPDYSIDLRWACKGQRARVIDHYEIDGGSPDIVTVFFRKGRDVIVLVKWSTNSHAADIQGDYYKTYIYRYQPKNFSNPFLIEHGVAAKLGEGWDGVIDGRPVRYPYKNALSIRKALDRMGYEDR